MEKVITINAWWDGPLVGLAYYNESICIYDRVFDEDLDDYIDEYNLLPITETEKDMIMAVWKKWCDAVNNNDLDGYYKEYGADDTIFKVLMNSDNKTTFRKKARFAGTLGSGYIPVDYKVEWS